MSSFIHSTAVVLALSVCTATVSGCLVNREGLLGDDKNSDAGSDATVADVTNDLSISVIGDGATETDGATPQDSGSEGDAILSEGGPLPDSSPSDAANDTGTPPKPDAGDGSVLPSDSGSPTPVEPPTGYPCLAVPYVNYTPTIDGVLDSRLAKLLIGGDMSQWTWFTYQDNQERTNISVSWATAVVPDGVWFYVQVKDDKIRAPVYDPKNSDDWKPWYGDTVELYFDIDGQFPNSPHYDDPGTAQFLIPTQAPSQKDAPFAFRYVSTGDSNAHDEHYDFGNRAVLKQQKSPGGYVVEVLLTEADVGEHDIFPNNIPDNIGLDIGVDSCEAPDHGDLCQTGNDQGEDTVAGLFVYHTTAAQDGGVLEPCDYTTSFCTPQVVHASN